MRFRVAIAMITAVGTAIGAFAVSPIGTRPALAGPSPDSPAATAAPEAVGANWHVDPGSAMDQPGANYVAGSAGRLTIAAGHIIALAYSPQARLADPASRFRMSMQADLPPGASVEIDLRGTTTAGWTEWQPLPTTLSVPTEIVQLRFRLSAGEDKAAPVLRDVSVSAEPADSPQSEAAAAVAYRVYATREGLVGGTTANGHVITARDHFVSLPSWRPLSPKGTGDYSVRACTSTRCVYEPVWDLGPWNTRDDYWNATREQWTGLPRGKPEAQAAYQDNYNGGKDQFGRVVTNPAGIDLADGSFWDGLGISSSGWVTVNYLWAGTGTHAQVGTSAGPINVRGGPSASAAKVGEAGGYARLPVECKQVGQNIAGYVRTSNVWLRIGPGNWVSYAYVRLDSGFTVPNC